MKPPRRLCGAFLLAAVLGLAALPARPQEPPGPPPLPAPPGRSWVGRWIWVHTEAPARNTMVCLRRAFDLESPPRDATLHVAADTHYFVVLNGEPLGRGSGEGGPGSPAYSTWDVGPVLRKGKNLLAVTVHHEGSGQPVGRPGMLLELTTSAGRTLARSDGTWKATPNPAWQAHSLGRMGPGLGIPAVYDARRELREWQSLESPEPDWPAAVEVGAPGEAPWGSVARSELPAERVEILSGVTVQEATELRAPTPRPELPSRAMSAAMPAPPRRITVRNRERLLRGAEGAEQGGAWLQTAPDTGLSLVVDFGRTVVGYPQFVIRGAKGGEILELGYGEVLQDREGRILSPVAGTTGMLNPERGGRHLADRYVCRTGVQGVQSFGRRVFRYLRLDLWNASEGIELAGVSASLPILAKATGAFRCSDERLNRIWEVGDQTAQLCRSAGFAAEPTRDPFPWPAEATLLARVNDVMVGDAGVRRSILRALAPGITSRGLPLGEGPESTARGPLAALAWIALLQDAHQHAGEADLVRAFFPRVRYLLDVVFRPGPDGLLSAVPDRVFAAEALQAGSGVRFRPNLLYRNALQSAAALAAAVADPAAEEYRRRAATVSDALHRRFWDGTAGGYRSTIQGPVDREACVLALVGELTPAPDRPRLVE
ncbi:MAG: hypothetical protein FJX77_07840, partial [Armatimonadetes bacterium]|nr:hypothetical protein [Armatimonadota bacterium]